MSDSKESSSVAPSDEPEHSAVFARDGARARPTSPQQAVAKTLIASARHELRSPLQSIQGFAELLGSESYGPLSEEQHAFVEHILQGSLELGATMEACLQLTEVELLDATVELELVDLRSAIGELIEQACRAAGTAAQTRFGAGLQNARTRLDKDGMRRALTALLKGYATGGSKVFRVVVELEGEHARLTLSLPNRDATGPSYLSIQEFGQLRRATRSLIWLRLAATLLAQQEADLLVTEPLDCAEVRIRLSRTH